MVGLCFLGLGVGSFFGLAIFSGTSDKIIKQKTAESKDGVSKPEFRLPSLPAAYLCLQFGLLMYGWTAEMRLHWVIPLIGTVFVGIGQLMSFMALQLYLIDAFQSYAASAIAVITTVRSVAGALLPLFGLRMYENIGVGWGNTLLAVVCLPLLIVALLLNRYGEAWRRRFEIKNL
jgi:MFS family permease